MNANWNDRQETINQIRNRLEEFGYSRKEIDEIQNWWSNFNQEPEWWLTAAKEEVEEAAAEAWKEEQNF